MSKISNYYLDLQEQANELGFDTVEEAFDAGYEACMGKLQLKDEQTKAHEAWLEERADVLEGLDLVLRGVDMPLEYSVKIVDAMDFIKKGEL